MALVLPMAPMVPMTSNTFNYSSSNVVELPKVIPWNKTVKETENEPPVQSVYTKEIKQDALVRDFSKFQQLDRKILDNNNNNRNKEKNWNANKHFEKLTELCADAAQTMRISSLLPSFIWKLGCLFSCSQYASP